MPEHFPSPPPFLSICKPSLLHPYFLSFRLPFYAMPCFINWLGRTDKKLSNCKRALPFNQSITHYNNQMKHHSVLDVTVSLYPYSFHLLRRVGETLWREVCNVHHLLVPGQLAQGQGQSAHMHFGAARGGP